MPALNYQQRFADKVETRAKRSTIRATRKHPFRVGDELFHYTGMRTRSCRKLGQAICTSVQGICIKSNGTISIDGQALYRPSAEKIAVGDGFETLEQFVEFFCQGGAEFHGQYIQW